MAAREIEIIPLETYIRNRLVPPKAFALAMDADQVRNMLSDATFAGGPPSAPTAAIVITPAPGQDDRFLGTPLCIGGGQLEFVQLGWNYSGSSQESAVRCGTTFRFTDNTTEFGRLGCTDTCQTGRCSPTFLCTSEGLTAFCSCQR